MMTDADLKLVRKLFSSRKPFNWRSWGIELIDEIRTLKKTIKTVKRAVAPDQPKGEDGG